MQLTEQIKKEYITQEQIDLYNEILETKQNEIIHLMNNVPLQQFVNIHQSTIKNYYIKEGALNDDLVNEFLWDNCYYEIIQERYREFFAELGLEEAKEWLHNEIEDDLLQYEIDGSVDIEDEDRLEEANDYFQELYLEQWSGWGFNNFVQEFIELYVSNRVKIDRDYKIHITIKNQDLEMV